MKTSPKEVANNARRAFANDAELPRAEGGGGALGGAA